MDFRGIRIYQQICEKHRYRLGRYSKIKRGRMAPHFSDIHKQKDRRAIRGRWSLAKLAGSPLILSCRQKTPDAFQGRPVGWLRVGEAPKGLGRALWPAPRARFLPALKLCD